MNENGSFGHNQVKPMTDDERQKWSREIIAKVATLDYDGSEDRPSVAEVKTILRTACQIGYSQVENVADAVDTLGMAEAVVVYLDTLEQCHEDEYATDDEEGEG